MEECDIQKEAGRQPLDRYLTIGEFTEKHLTSPKEWDEFVAVKNAKPSKPEYRWLNGEYLPKPLEPNPAFDRLVELKNLFSFRFFEALASGLWTVTTIRELRRTEIDPELLYGKLISFSGSTILPFTRIKISSKNSGLILDRLIRFIGQLCEHTPAEKALNKAEIQTLAEKMMPFVVRDDLFKLAWRQADIPDSYRTPGRKPGHIVSSIPPV